MLQHQVQIYIPHIKEHVSIIKWYIYGNTHVAGVAALLANQGYSITQIRQIIESTTDKISGTGTYWKNGRINAYKAVQYAKQLQENKAS